LDFHKILYRDRHGLAKKFIGTKYVQVTIIEIIFPKIIICSGKNLFTISISFPERWKTTNTCKTGAHLILIAFGLRDDNMGRPPPTSLTVSFTPSPPAHPTPTAIDDHPPPLRCGRVGVSEYVRERARQSCRLTAGCPTEMAHCTASSMKRRASHAPAHTRPSVRSLPSPKRRA